MELINKEDPIPNLNMASEEHYKKQADHYRKSPAYSKMLRLYPLLQSYIKQCEDETLVA